MTPTAPIACTLDGESARRRWNEWTSLMARRTAAELSPDRLTVHFPASAVFSTRLRELVTAERECCGFVDWELADTGDETVLTVCGDRDGVLAMAQSFKIHGE